MKTASRFIGIFQISMVIFFLCTQAFADRPAPPRDFKKVTENGQFVFVMLAPEGSAIQDPAIRTVYSQSGLYRNDGSPVPLWTVDWYSFEVYPSSDGEHLVRMGPWASSTHQPAISFYRNGREIKAYRIKDLVHDESKLRRTVSHFFWRAELKYDHIHNVLFLRTVDNQIYRFSVKTGEILPY